MGWGQDSARAFEPEDAEHIIRWNRDQRSWAIPRLSMATDVGRLGAVLGRVCRPGEDGKRLLSLFIETKSGEAVGTVRTHSCDRKNGTFSYSVDVDPIHQRKGYATKRFK